MGSISIGLGFFFICNVAVKIYSDTWSLLYFLKHLYDSHLLDPILPSINLGGVILRYFH